MVEVSIIIPTKNRPQLLNRAINSVINQTYQNWELLIINDSESEVLINFSDSRIQLAKNSNKPGANGARNTGINLATGRYIAYLDDDDTWESGKLLKQVKIMESQNAILCYTGKKIIYQKNNKSQIKYSYNSTKLFPQLGLQFHNYIGTTSTVMIKSSILKEEVKFDENIQSLQDFDLFLRLAELGSFVGIPEFLVNYYFDGNIAHTSFEKIAFIKSAWQIFKKQKGIYRITILLSLTVILVQKIYNYFYYKLF